MPHRIVVKTNAATRDAFGAMTPENLTVERTVYGRLVPIGGSERYHHGRQVAHNTRFVEMIYDPNNVLTTDKVLFHGTKRLNIEYIENVGERNRMIVARCTEVEDV